MTADYRDLKVADPAAMNKWRAWHDEQEAERARDEQHTKRFHTIKNLRDELRHEIAAVRAEAESRADIGIEATGEALGGLRKEITDQVEAALKGVQTQYRDTERELFRLVERRFAELAGRLDALAPDARSRTKGEFRFASEKGSDDETVDLPNPIVLRGSEQLN